MFCDCRVDVEFTRCSGDNKNAKVATVDDMARTNFSPDSNRDNRELRVRDCAHYRSIALFAPDEPISFAELSILPLESPPPSRLCGVLRQLNWRTSIAARQATTALRPPTPRPGQRLPVSKKKPRAPWLPDTAHPR